MNTSADKFDPILKIFDENDCAMNVTHISHLTPCASEMVEIHLHCPH